jgi:type IV secretory pathway VirB2 component (pilin)
MNRRRDSVSSTRRVCGRDAGSWLKSASLNQAAAATVVLVVAVLWVLCTPAVAHAAGAGAGAVMPWTGPLQALLDNLSGPTARIVAGLGFVIGGGIWAFSRSEEGAKRFGQIVIGAAIAIGAANIVTSLAFVGAVV